MSVSEVLVLVFAILSVVVGGVMLYASLMALTLTETESEEKRDDPEGASWFDMLIPVFSTIRAVENLRRNWWRMRGPSILVLVGAGLMVLAFLLQKFF